MKIKNIFFAAILVLAGFSCSMEDDAIMNDVEKGIEEATEAYTVLDFGVAFNEMATKLQQLLFPVKTDLQQVMRTMTKKRYLKYLYSYWKMER